MSTHEMRYCLDASSLIHAAYRAYPVHHFPALWSKIDDLIKMGRFIMPIEVYNELERKDDKLHTWCKDRKKNICQDIDNEVQNHLIRLMSKYPRLVDTHKGKSGADPFVLAQALARSPRLTVVTEEKGGSESSPKIPFVCNCEGLRCINILTLIQEEGWIF